MQKRTIERALCNPARRWAGAALALALVPAGCSSMNDTEKGAVAGGALGGVTGGIIGHALHNTGAGALVGAAAGAVGGGLIGNAMDEQKKETDAKIAATAQRPVLGVTDIVQMVRQGMSDTVIINEIRTTGSVFYNLSPNDLAFLHQNGVDDAVITEMQTTVQRVPQRVYTAAPVYAQPVYVYDPPPPVAVGVGFGYGGRWR